MAKVKANCSFHAEVVKAIKEKRPIQLAAKWNVKHYRDGELLSEQEKTNLFTTQGLNHMVDVVVGNGTQITQWYIEMATALGGSPVAGDTYASHLYTAANTEVSDSSRLPFTVSGTAASGSDDNTASPCQYTSAGSHTFVGAALVGGGSTPTSKADAAGGGTLLSFDAFGSSVTTVLNDVVTITVTFTLAST